MASPSRGGGGGEAQPTGKKAKGKKNKGKGGGGGGGSGGGGAGGKRKAAEESSDDEDDGPAPKVKRRKLADASAKWKVMQLEPFKGNFVRADLGCPFCGEYPGTWDPFNCTADSAPPKALQARGKKYDLQFKSYTKIKELYQEFMRSQ